MQTQKGRKGPRGGWGSRLILVLVAVLNLVFGTGTVQAKSVQQAPPNAVSCGNTVAAVHQPGQQVVTYNVNQPSITGLVLQPTDNMTTTINGKLSKFVNEENGHLWTAMVNSGAITMAVATGPDSPFVSFTGPMGELQLIRESIGAAAPISPGTYEKLEFAITPNGGPLKACVVGAFNDPANTANITFQLMVNGRIVQQVQLDQSQYDETLDLVELTTTAAATDEVKVVVSALENPSQAREEYFLIGLGLQGARMEDTDGDGIPNPDDPDDVTPRECLVSGGYTSAPRHVGEVFQLDLQYVGQKCGGFTLIHILPGELTLIEVAQENGEFVPAGLQCLDFTGQSGTEVVCLTGDQQRIRITLILAQPGVHTLFAVLSDNRAAYRYWAAELEVLPALVVYNHKLYLAPIGTAQNQDR